MTVDEEDHKDDAASVDMEGSMHEREVETGQKRKMLARAESANVVQGESAKRIKEDGFEVGRTLIVVYLGCSHANYTFRPGRTHLIPLQRWIWKTPPPTPSKSLWSSLLYHHLPSPRQ